jgi:HAE1 family hydrophobic/amphiphilic exporter-1
MNYFLENRITAYMLFAGLFIFGLIALGKLSVSLMPQTGYPGISVIIEYPGVAPEKIETAITKPVEKIVKTVSGIEKINSISEEGRSRININFQIDTDIKIAALKVREKIGLIRPYFPREVQEAVVFRYDPSDRPVLIATIEKEGASQVETREIVERKIKSRLQRIEGISEINIAGGLKREIHINIDRGRFEARNLSFTDIFPIIQGSNTSIPGGLLPSGNREYVVYTTGRYKSISEIADTAIMQTAHGSTVRLYDVAEVVSSYRDREDIARLDGRERITVYIQKAGDANTLDVCYEAVKLLKEHKDFKTRIVYNQGRYITAAVDNVASSCTWGIIIVVMVLYLFLRRFSTVLTIALSIPLSIVIVFLCMYFINLDLDVMCLSGLALGAGMIVDNGIVISESIYRHESIDRATILRGVSEVRNAIVSSTFTTIAVFFPIVFGNIMTRRMYGGLAFTVSSALIISLVVAVILIPSILSAIEERSVPHRVWYTVIPANLKIHEKILPYATDLLCRVDRIERMVINRYELIYDYAFKNRKRIFALTLALSLISLLLLTRVRSEFVDPLSIGEFYVYLEFPTGTSLSHTDEAVSLAEKKIQSMNVTGKIATRVEKWRGTLSIKLKESISTGREQRAIKEKIKADLNGILKGYGGFVFLTEADEVSSRELSITFIGSENSVLKKIARNAARGIGSLPGIEDCVLRFREGRPEFTLSVDREKAEASFVSAQNITDFFRNAVFGPVVTKFIDRDREVDVRMRYLKHQRDSIDEIINYAVKNEASGLIPAREIITLNEQIGPTKIWRQDGRRCVTITAKIGRLSYDEAEKKIGSVLGGIEFPPEYTYEFDENLKQMKENRRSMTISIIFAIIFVYMILASLFESLKIPLIIMTTVPLALIGVLIALFITSSTLNISVYIGLIVLAGIVVNNGIILINSINSGYRENKFNAATTGEFIKSVCLTRFRPILITTITTVLGLLPMLIKGGEGSNLWRPLSLTVISGLAFSTPLTLVIVPLFSYTMYVSYFTRRKK